MDIYCCGCNKNVSARLTNGSEIYSHRKDLADTPFWICDTCKNYVGCHHKTGTPTKPLGSIPTPELKRARQQIHRILDPLWKSGKFRRNQIYQKISSRLGFRFHTAEIRTLEEATRVETIIKEIIRKA